MPYRAKRKALLLVALSFGISIAFFVPGWLAKLTMGVGGTLLAAGSPTFPRTTPRTGHESRIPETTTKLKAFDPYKG